jgi:SAM-dependent methyltransferase
MEDESGFDLDYFAQMDTVVDTNFWFQGRNKLIRWLVSRFTGTTKPAEFLEIGCGTGIVMAELRKLPNLRLSGGELYVMGLDYTQRRVPEAQLCQFDAFQIPFDGHFDAIGMFDVLEHIDDDVRILQNVHKGLRPGGHFYITVPQYPFLWSFFDEFQGHRRRYTRSELRQKLQNAGFTVRFQSSFVFSLFPGVLFARWRNKGQQVSNAEALRRTMADLRKPPLINSMFEVALGIDLALIRLGVRLPWGSSLVMVAQKPVN